MLSKTNTPMPEHLRLPRWNDVLIAIYKAQQRKPYCQRLNREIHGSLTHLREIVKTLAEQQLIEVYNGKKTKHIMLTEKGRQVTESLLNIKEHLRHNGNLSHAD